MGRFKQEELERHIKTHSERSAEDRAAVSVLETFLISDGKINTEFSKNDKWPNIDGHFELVPNPTESRRPKQNFIVQIKGSSNYSIDENGNIKYRLQSLAFPAFIATEVTSDPGILFIVLNPESRIEKRVFWKYISPKFYTEIDFNKDSLNVVLTSQDEIKYSEESVDEFVKKLVLISEKHSFMKQLEIRDFDCKDIKRVIEARSNDICREIKMGIVLNDTRDNISQRILTQLRDLCEGTLMLNAFLYYNPVNLRLSWEIALTDINTKFLATFLQGLKYIGMRVPEEGQSERIMLKYYAFLWKLRKYLKDYHRMVVLENLEDFPRGDNEEDKEYNKLVAEAIDKVTDNNSPLKFSRYYVQRKNEIFIGTDRYFEITLQLASKYATKYNRLTVYTKLDISTNYSIRIGIEEIDLQLWTISTKIKVITNWKVSIDPSILNKLARIVGKETLITSRYNEYDSLMNFLSRTGINLLDFIDMRDERFNNLINEIYGQSHTDYFKYVLLELHQKYNSTSHAYGKNTIRYVLQRLREEIVESVMMEENEDKPKNVAQLSKKCYPFEMNPVLYNLPNHKTNNNTISKDVARAIGGRNIQKYLPYVRIKHLINSTGEIYFDKNDVEYGNGKQSVEAYNNYLDEWDKNNGLQIIEKEGFVYIDNYVQDTKNIMLKLLEFCADGNEGQKQLNQRFVKDFEYKSVDASKIIALENAFVNSKIMIIYGAAGTGKTTLMNYISSLMDKRSKLYVTKTHTALENLKRRIISPGSESEFLGIDKVVKARRQLDFDLIFIDECSTIDNRTMIELLKLVDENSLVVLAGDIYQIESIDFGNWFFYAKNILPDKAIVELNSTWRTEEESIKELWEEVRFKKPLITEKLAIDGPFSEDLSASIFNRNDDEIVLCLNYDGKFGLNNINGYFQDANPSEKTYIWQEWKYKIGDPILFNDSKRFPMLYNNLKGKIIDIQEGNECIHFVIDVEISLTALDARNTDLELIEFFENSTRIGFFVYASDGGTTEEERELANMKSIVPFQLAYAVSIHKAQGLEYNSVKVVIPNSNSEKITHGVFYTAITRTKEKLKLFWNAETMDKVVKSFYEVQSDQYSLELIKKEIEAETKP